MALVTIKQIDSQQAGKFLCDIAHAPVFAQPEVLQCLVPSVDWWIASRGDEDVCLWPVPLDQDSRPTIPPFAYYVGPVWVRSALERPPSHIRSSVHAVYDCFIETLFTRYGSIRAELDPSQHDVRPFLWWNFGVSGAPRIAVEPRYTAVVDNLGVFSRETWVRNMRSVRRREALRLNSSDILRQDVVDPEMIQDAYARVLARQSVSPTVEVLGVIEQIWKLTRKGRGWAYRWSVAGRDGPSSICLILKDRSAAHLVLRLSQLCDDHPGLPSVAILDAMQLASEQGIQRFDFNGANSPQRGDDKHAFGAPPELFFRIHV